MDQLNTVTKNIDSSMQKVTLANLTLENIKTKTLTLKYTADNLKQNSTKLQERNVEGALNLTKQAYEKATVLKNEENNLDARLADAERQCKRADTFFNRNVNNLNQGIKDNENTLEKLDQEMNILNKEIPKLNQKICDGGVDGSQGEICDKLCGGAGCGFCGGLSCGSGATTKAESAYSYAKNAEKHIRDKEAKAEELFRGMSQVNQEMNLALLNATAIGEMAKNARIQSENILNESYALIERHEKFLNPTGIQSSDIAMKVEEVLKLNINLKPEQLQQLSEDINRTLSLPKNIDTIIADTAGDLALAKMLNEDAEKKQMAAKDILQVAERVEKALAEAETIQKEVDSGLETTNQNIVDTTDVLDKVKEKTALTQKNVQGVLEATVAIEGKLKLLQTGFLKNVRDADEVKSEAKTLVQEVKNTDAKASQLVVSYNNANDTLNNRVKNTQATRSKSQSLLEKASQLSTNITLKLKELEDAEKEFELQKGLIELYSNKADELNKRMSENLEKINAQSEYYKTCNN